MTGMNVTSPSFSGAYTRWDVKGVSKWVEVTKEGLRVTEPNELKKEFESSLCGHAMIVNCDNFFIDFGVLMKAMLIDLKVILTGKEAEKFKLAITEKDQRSVLNDVYGSLFQFGSDVTIDKKGLDQIL